MLTRRFNQKLPQWRRKVISWLPPPLIKREPLAKSLPAISAATKQGISFGSADPSASSMTMMSPVQAAKPALKASPLNMSTKQYSNLCNFICQYKKHQNSTLGKKTERTSSLEFLIPSNLQG